MHCTGCRVVGLDRWTILIGCMAEQQPITARQQPDFSNMRHAKIVALRGITALADWHHFGKPLPVSADGT